MKNGRMTKGTNPTADGWVNGGRVEADGCQWIVWWHAGNLDQGFVNFKVVAVGRVRGPANYWVAWGPKGPVVTTGRKNMKENRPMLFEKVEDAKRRIYLRAVNVLGQPAQGQGTLV